jgi:hypothetical protein
MREIVVIMKKAIPPVCIYRMCELMDGLKGMRMRTSLAPERLEGFYSV